MRSSGLFFFLSIGKYRHGTCIGKKRWLFSIENGAKIWPLEKGRKSPEKPVFDIPCLKIYFSYLTGASSFTQAMKMGSEVYHHLKAVIKKKYGQDGKYLVYSRRIHKLSFFTYLYHSYGPLLMSEFCFYSIS